MNINDIYEHNKRMDNLVKTEVQNLAKSVNSMSTGRMALAMFALGCLTVALATWVFL
ncbi:hypothetical protein KRX19_07455 [Cardiobacteriaceae bacterium TAE3-ERU3]|nr:hypothetical protein [Cardiobacteriaceae bacterium TAE3-ERU3]